MKVFLFFALSLISIAVNAMSVTFHDGAERVGGSCAIVSNDTTLVMVDCGALGGEEAALRSYIKYGGFPFDPTKIDALLITHAHQDHVGRVPDLIRAGFRGRIIANSATRELLRITWQSYIQYDSSVKRAWRWSSFQGKNNRTSLHWRPDCVWGSRIKPINLRTFDGRYNELLEKFESKETGRRTSVCMTCCEAELNDLLSRVESLEFGSTNKVGSLSITLKPTKHLPGASAIYISNGEKSCVFSGDLGTYRSRLVKEIEPAEKVDAIFVEATYGAAGKIDGKAVDKEYASFIKFIGETVSTNGVAWIPAFALDRTQRVLVEIGRGINSGIIPSDVQLYLPSPTARKNAELYATNTVWFDSEDISFLSPMLKKAHPGLGRKNPSTMERSILVTTSGMMDAALSYELLPSLLPRSDVAVCIVGYQAEGTPGLKVKEGATNIVLNVKGKMTNIAIKCNTKVFDCFSGHADAREVDLWLKKNKKSKVYLVHGDKKALKERAEDLKTNGFKFVKVAIPATTYEL